MKEHESALDLAAEGKLPASISGSSRPSVAVIGELVDAGYIKAVDASSMDGPAYLNPTITLAGREYLARLRTKGDHTEPIQGLTDGIHPKLAKELKYEEKITVVFDMCSSSTLIEELIRIDKLAAMSDLITSMKRLLKRESETLRFDVHKFLGDGWILLFDVDVAGVALVEFMERLSCHFQSEFEAAIAPLLSSIPPVIGLTFGIDKGRLMSLTLLGRGEYIGRALNVASRLQTAIKDLENEPQYKVLFSKNAYADLHFPSNFRSLEYVKKSLRNINGNEEREFVKVSLRMQRSGAELGLNAVAEGRPGWKFAKNWQIQEKEIANWELGPDWFNGSDEGHIVWRTPLPKSCRIEFEARITQIKDGSADEIDVIVGDVMVLYYKAGIKLDWMTEDLVRERNKKMVGSPATQVGKWYRYSIVVTESNNCVLSIDGSKTVEFNCDLGRTWFRGRLGFAHWKDSIEVRNLKIQTLKG